MTSPRVPSKSCILSALVSIGAGLLILSLKSYAATISHSAALKSDAIESVVNVLAAVFALVTICLADKPADLKFPYGYGKVEHFSALFEGCLIGLAALLIACEAVRAMVAPLPLERLGTGLVINLAAGACNGLLGVFLVRTGRSLRSQALEADGHHVLADFQVTLGLVLSLLLVAATGIRWLDPVIALGVSGVLGFTGFDLVRKAASALLERLVAAMNRVRPREIMAFHQLKTMRAGRRTYVDIHIVVPEYDGLAQSHGRATAFAEEVVSLCGIEGELRVHVDPCGRIYCGRCAMASCPVRTVPQKDLPAIGLDEAVSPDPSWLFGAGPMETSHVH